MADFCKLGNIDKDLKFSQSDWSLNWTFQLISQRNFLSFQLVIINNLKYLQITIENVYAHFGMDFIFSKKVVNIVIINSQPFYIYLLISLFNHFIFISSSLYSTFHHHNLSFFIISFIYLFLPIYTMQTSKISKLKFLFSHFLLASSIYLYHQSLTICYKFE